MSVNVDIEQEIGQLHERIERVERLLTTVETLLAGQSPVQAMQRMAREQERMLAIVSAARDLVWHDDPGGRTMLVMDESLEPLDRLQRALRVAVDTEEGDRR
jgi:hypothetical protein